MIPGTALRPRPLARRIAGALALACALGGRAAAQEAPQADTLGAAQCEQGRISTIFVDPHSVFDLTDPELNQRFNWAYRFANGLHVSTRERVVRTELLFAEGECYDVEALRDSERLLRSLPFIAEVDVFGVRQADGTVHVIVDTQDEWSTRVEARVGSGGVLGLNKLRLREDNLLGTGRHVSAFLVSDEEEQVYGLSFFTPQLFDTRWDAQLEAGRTPVGTLLRQAVIYPFVGETGRWAFRQALEHDEHYFEFRVPGPEALVPVWYPEQRRRLELGGAYRWGERGLNRTVLGAALTGEWLAYPDEPRLANEEDTGPGGRAIPLPRLGVDSVSSVRAMVMMGQRNVYFIRRRGLDTVNGTEDVQLGVDTELAIGPSIPGLSTDRDLALDFGLFAGGEFLGAHLGGGHLMVQARRDYDAPPDRSEWSDVFAQLHLWTYWRSSPESRRTLVAAVAAVGGWHNRVPFQLTLGSESGLRGSPDHAYPGGRRVVASLEHRAYLGWPLPDLLDLGTVAFVDVGKIWAGDAPFGVDSPLRVDAGLGLRAAFPPGSGRTLRVDVGVPVGGGGGVRDAVLSIGIGQRVGSSGSVRDAQMERSVRRGLSALFSNPVRF